MAGVVFDQTADESRQRDLGRRKTEKAAVFEARESFSMSGDPNGVLFVHANGGEIVVRQAVLRSETLPLTMVVAQQTIAAQAHVKPAPAVFGQAIHVHRDGRTRRRASFQTLAPHDEKAPRSSDINLSLPALEDRVNRGLHPLREGKLDGLVGVTPKEALGEGANPYRSVARPQNIPWQRD